MVDIVTYADPPVAPSLKKKRRRSKRRSRSIERKIIDAQYERFSVKRKLQRVTDRAQYMERMGALQRAAPKANHCATLNQAFLAGVLGLLLGACIQMLMTALTTSE